MEHNEIGLVTHALRCLPQVPRIVSVDSIHVHTADGLEKLPVQLPSISG